MGGRQAARMKKTSSCLLLLALVASAQLAYPAAAAEQKSNSRKLLQPFNLGLGRGDRTKANAGLSREGLLNALANGGISQQLDTDPNVDAAINAGGSQASFGTNLNFGGVTKSTIQNQAQTDLDNAKTLTSMDGRSIAKPGPGLTALSQLERSTVISQRRIAPAGPATSPPPGAPGFIGPNENRPLGSWDVLTATAEDYGWVGDYDYSLYDALKNAQTYVATAQEYDYDYGQPRVIPETAKASSRTATNLNDTPGRAAAFARRRSAATAPNAVSRQYQRAVGLVGQSAARANADLFGTGTVFVPANPVINHAAASSGVARATSWKPAILPGATSNSGNAGAVVSRTYQPAGGWSDQLTSVSGTKSSQARSETVALGSVENLDFADVGRH